MTAVATEPDPHWHYTLLSPKGPGLDRRPLIPHPQNLRDPSPEELRYAKLAWTGATDVTLEGLHAAISAGFHVGMYPASSGLVVLDCDVKYYERLTGHVVPPETVRMTAPGTFEERRGVDHLYSVIRHLDLDVESVRTHTIRTKSDGLHFVYAANPSWPMLTTGHRENWQVDIIAHNGGSDRSWIATYPSPGYTVIDDRPPTVLPDRLAWWLTVELPRLAPIGGHKRQRLDAAHAALQGRMATAGLLGDSTGYQYLDQYVAVLEDAVLTANKFGEWNKQLFKCSAALFEIGFSQEEGTARMLAAAAPWNDDERRKATSTIKSAWKSAHRKKGGRK